MQKPDADRMSQQQPAWHVAVLGALTCWVYLVYWAYKTWRLLKQQACDEQRLAEHPALSLFKDISPALRTLALLSPLAIQAIPFVANILKTLICDATLIYVLGTLVLGIASLAPNQRSFAHRHPLLACGLVLGSWLAICSVARLPGAWYIAAILAGPVPCAFVQHWLNDYLIGEEAEDLLVRHGFNVYEMVAIIVGASILGLGAAGMMIGVKPH